jgi:hypothetical protein
MDPLLKPKALPAHPKFLDRVEYALGWLTWRCTIYWPGRPCLSGLLSSLIMTPVALLLGGLIFLVLSAIKLFFEAIGG